MSATNKPDFRTIPSSSLEEASPDLSRGTRQETWVAENREATVAYNKHVEEHGVFSDGLRGF